MLYHICSKMVISLQNQPKSVFVLIEKKIIPICILLRPITLPYA